MTLRPPKDSFFSVTWYRWGDGGLTVRPLFPVRCLHEFNLWFPTEPGPFHYQFVILHRSYWAPWSNEVHHGMHVEGYEKTWLKRTTRYRVGALTHVQQMYLLRKSCREYGNYFTGSYQLITLMSGRMVSLTEGRKIAGGATTTSTLGGNSPPSFNTFTCTYTNQRERLKDLTSYSYHSYTLCRVNYRHRLMSRANNRG